MVGGLDDTRREIERLVGEALARFGIAGRVHVDAAELVLSGHGPSVSAAHGGLVEQWDGLSDDLRKRRCNDIARQLAFERRRASAFSGGAGGFKLPGFVAPLGVLALAAVLIWGAWRVFDPSRAARRSTPATVKSADQYESERRAREARVCESARERVLRGTTVTVSDSEGWAVEMVVLRHDGGPALVNDAKLAEFVELRPGAATGRFVFRGAEHLAATRGVDTDVTVLDASMPGFSGVRLVFSGRYVQSYFREEERPEYVRAAAALAERLGARYGALFARCAHAESHQLGSWAIGPGPSGAAASLLYFVGVQAEVCQVKPSVFGSSDGGAAVDRGHALGAIVEATKRLDRNKLAALVGAHGGAIAGRNDGIMTVSFPFKDGNRAARASHDIARALKIATEQ